MTDRACQTCGERFMVSFLKCCRCGADYPLMALTKRTWVYAAQFVVLLVFVVYVWVF